MQSRYSRCVSDGSQLELCLEAGSERVETRSCILNTCEEFPEKKSSFMSEELSTNDKSDVISTQSTLNFPTNPSPTENYSQNVSDSARLHKHLTDEILSPSDIYFFENHTVIAKKHHNHNKIHSRRVTSNRSWDVLKKRLLRENGKLSTFLLYIRAQIHTHSHTHIYIYVIYIYIYI